MLISIFKRNKSFLYCVAIALILVGCQSSKQEGTGQAKENSHLKKDTLPYEFRTLRVESPYLAERDSSLDTTYAEVTYPVFNERDMDRLVQSTILLEGEPDIQTYVNNFIEGYGNFIEENDMNYPIAWEKKSEVSISLYTPDLICIKNATYEYSGGAHGNFFENTSVFELENYRKLDLNTFISDNKMKEFINIAENIFRKDEGLSDTSSLEQGYFFENGQFALAANYAITKEGILFHYNPYEIKAYSYGITNLLVPYDKVQGLMTETGKLYIKNLKEYYQ